MSTSSSPSRTGLASGIPVKLGPHAWPSTATAPSAVSCSSESPNRNSRNPSKSITSRSPEEVGVAGGMAPCAPRGAPVHAVTPHASPWRATTTAHRTGATIPRSFPRATGRGSPHALAGAESGLEQPPQVLRVSDDHLLDPRLILVVEEQVRAIAAA